MLCLPVVLPKPRELTTIPEAPMDLETSKNLFISLTKLAISGLDPPASAKSASVLLKFAFQAFTAHLLPKCHHRLQAYLPDAVLFEPMLLIINHFNTLAPAVADPIYPKMTQYPTLYPPFYIYEHYAKEDSEEHIGFVVNFIHDLSSLKFPCRKCGSGGESLFFPLADQFFFLPITQVMMTFTFGWICGPPDATLTDMAYDCVFKLLPVLSYRRVLYGDVLYWLYFSLFYALGNQAAEEPNNEEGEEEDEEEDSVISRKVRKMISLYTPIFARLSLMASRNDPADCMKAALALTKANCPKTEVEIDQKRKQFVRFLDPRVSKPHRLTMVNTLADASVDEKEIERTLMEFAEMCANDKLE